jgi:hypothetical protein
MCRLPTAHPRPASPLVYHRIETSLCPLLDPPTTQRRASAHSLVKLVCVDILPSQVRTFSSDFRMHPQINSTQFHSPCILRCSGSPSHSLDSPHLFFGKRIAPPELCCRALMGVHLSVMQTLLNFPRFADTSVRVLLSMISLFPSACDACFIPER